MTKEERMIKLFRNNLFYFIGAIVGFICIISSNYTAPMGFILLFNAFDLFGFNNIFNPLKKLDYEVYENLLPNYRVIQTMFEIILVLFMFNLYGWMVIISSLILHFSGVQDIAFYIFGKYELPKQWTWLNWTFVGWFGAGSISNKLVLLQAILGILISISVFFA